MLQSIRLEQKYLWKTLTCTEVPPTLTNDSPLSCILQCLHNNIRGFLGIFKRLKKQQVEYWITTSKISTKCITPTINIVKTMNESFKKKKQWAHSITSTVNIKIGTPSSWSKSCMKQTCHSRTLQDWSKQLIIDSADTTRTHSKGQVENVTWVPCSNLHKHDPLIWEWDSTHATTSQGSQNPPSHVSGSNNLSSPFMPKTLARNPKSAINLVWLGLNTIINPCRVAIP